MTSKANRNKPPINDEFYATLPLKGMDSAKVIHFYFKKVKSKKVLATSIYYYYIFQCYFEKKYF